jgi:hypothetical protein
MDELTRRSGGPDNLGESDPSMTMKDRVDDPRLTDQTRFQEITDSLPPSVDATVLSALADILKHLGRIEAKVDRLLRD